MCSALKHQTPKVTMSISCQLFRLVIGSLISCTLVSAFSSQAERQIRSSALYATKRCNNEQSRTAFLASTVITLSTVFLPSASNAAQVTGCPPDSKSCISTLNVKNIDSYSPPWTFEVSPDEAFARIKGVLASDDAYRFTEVDSDARYIKANVARPFPDKGSDEVEFLVKGDDKVVVFRISEKEAGLSDPGGNKRRIDSIRKRGAVFDLMGGGMTADSYDGGGAVSKGNNPFGQLKAFYGLQSGEGFESVFEDEDE